MLYNNHFCYPSVHRFGTLSALPREQDVNQRRRSRGRSGYLERSCNQAREVLGLRILQRFFCSFLKSLFGGEMTLRKVIQCLAAVLLLGGAMAYAQTASITGTIVDASGAGVPDATVTAKNQATAGVRTAMTSDTGTY